MPTLADITHVHARADTATLHDLCGASMKLYQSESHGKVFAWIDSGLSFFETAVFSTARLVRHVALAAFSLIGIFSQSGRRFLVENAVRSAIDITGVLIGLIGTLSPWTGHDLTAKEVMVLNRFLMKHEFMSEKSMKGMTYEAPIWIARYLYQYAARMLECAQKHWGGSGKIQYKTKT